MYFPSHTAYQFYSKPLKKLKSNPNPPVFMFSISDTTQLQPRIKNSDLKKQDPKGIKRHTATYTKVHLTGLLCPESKGKGQLQYMF